MINPLAVLTPWMFWIKLGVLAVIVSSLFIGGCQYGKGRQYKKDQAMLAEMDVALNAQRVQNAILTATLKSVDDQVIAAQQAAKDQAAFAKQAEARAAKAEAEYGKAAKQVESDLVQAKRDPDCKRILEQKTCATLR